jgi:thioredoxin 1
VAAIEINDSNFESHVKNGVVMVDFWATWCTPCRMIAPIMDELSNEFKNQVTIAKVNADENIQVAGKYGVTSVPTLMVFKNGQLVERRVGAAPKQQYMSMLNKHLSE